MTKGADPASGKLRFTDAFQEIDLQTALELAASHGYLRTEERQRLLVAVLSDGTEVAWQSECSGPYSELTPDLNWKPPTIWARMPSKPESSRGT